MSVSTVKLNGVTLMTVADTTAVAADVESGKYFYNSAGVKTAGTANARTDLINMTPVAITDHDLDYVITKNQFTVSGIAADTFMRTLQDISCTAGSYEFDFGSLITSSSFMLQLFNVTDNSIIYSFGTWDSSYTYTFTLSDAKTIRIRTTTLADAVVDEEHELHLYTIGEAT